MIAPSIRYRPASGRTVDRLVEGTVTEDSAPQSIASPSIQTFDRRLVVAAVRDPLSGERLDDLVLWCDSRSLVPLQASARYLFALGADDCIGFVPLTDEDEVRLSDGSRRPVADFAREQVGHAFVDDRAPTEIVPGGTAAGEEPPEPVGAVTVETPLSTADTVVPPGTYGVAADEQAHVFLLSAGDLIALPAVQRASKARVARASAELRAVPNEPRRLLVVRMPPATEWIVPLKEQP